MIGNPIKEGLTQERGEKNYRCKFCGKEFDSAEKVAQHIMSNHTHKVVIANPKG